MPNAYEGEWRYTFVADDLEDASAKWDALDSYAESLGFNGEVGTVSRLDPDELIPGSPTAKRLHEANSIREESCQ